MSVSSGILIKWTKGFSIVDMVSQVFKEVLLGIGKAYTRREYRTRWLIIVSLFLIKQITNFNGTFCKREIHDFELGNNLFSITLYIINYL